MSDNASLLSTAYFPPVDYISIFTRAEEVFIEREENYIKQTFRNRCFIYSANGPMMLTVPVLEGSFHKKPVKDIRIDYSKRWQHIHLGALTSSYKSSPYFEFYFSSFESVISSKHVFLLDLNMHSLEEVLRASGITTACHYTYEFNPPEGAGNDHRYSITPKKRSGVSIDGSRKYNQVFGERYGFIPGLSMIDLIFNTGPDSQKYL